MIKLMTQNHDQVSLSSLFTCYIGVEIEKSSSKNSTTQKSAVLKNEPDKDEKSENGS